MVSGYAAHGEGGTNTASGDYSHAEGNNNDASGNISHVEGLSNIASGLTSHAEGTETVASGTNSHTEGFGTLSNHDNLLAIGKFNISKAPVSDGTTTNYTFFEIGNGENASSRKNALEVWDSGKIIASSLTMDLINEDKVLVTKEYVDALPTSTLKELNEGNGVGWTVQCRIDNATNYGNIGHGALDFSASNVAGDYGATGRHSFAVGDLNTASGESATSFGKMGIASGEASVTTGINNTASGVASFAAGFATNAIQAYQFSVGKYNLSPYGSLFVVGNGTQGGTAGDDRNAFEVYDTGAVIAPGLYNSLIQHNQSLVTKEYVESLDRGELSKIIENSVSGWTLRNDNRDNKGDIGTNAIDLSYSDIPSSTYGATGVQSFTTGIRTTAAGAVSFAEGQNTSATGDYSHSEGLETSSEATASHSEGYLTEAKADYSHAEGSGSRAYLLASHAEGIDSYAQGEAAHAEGYNTKASANYSHAEGQDTIAQNMHMHAAGYLNIGTSTETIHETGIGFLSSGVAIRKNAFEIYRDGSIKAPELTITLIDQDNRSLVTKEYVDSMEQGQLIKITEGSSSGLIIRGDDRDNKGDTGEHAIDFSYSDINSDSYGALGNYSLAEGIRTAANGISSHTEGQDTIADGDYSHAEGLETSAQDSAAHAEGYYTEAKAEASHAEGDGSRAYAYASHAEGITSYSQGEASHAEGKDTKSVGDYSHAEGRDTVAQNEHMHAAGYWNVGTSTETIHETGIGTAWNDKKNAFEIYTNGRIRAPELTTTLIDHSRSLVTKEYVDACCEGSDSGSGIQYLNDLTDVTITSSQDEDYLQWDSASSMWINKPLKLNSIDDLADVDTTTNTPITEDYLKWDGVNWVPETPQTLSIDELNDVDTTTSIPAIDDYLKWDGNNWIPATPQYIEIDNISDVDTSTTDPTDGQVLKWDGVNWVPQNIEISGTSANRPSSPYVGQMYFDTDLAKPIWYTGSDWVDAVGNIV